MKTILLFIVLLVSLPRYSRADEQVYLGPALDREDCSHKAYDAGYQYFQYGGWYLGQYYAAACFGVIAGGGSSYDYWYLLSIDNGTNATLSTLKQVTPDCALAVMQGIGVQCYNIINDPYGHFYCESRNTNLKTAFLNFDGTPFGCPFPIYSVFVFDKRPNDVGGPFLKFR